MDDRWKDINATVRVSQIHFGTVSVRCSILGWEDERKTELQPPREIVPYRATVTAVTYKCVNIFV